MAYSILQRDRVVKAAAYVGAASMCRAGIAKAEPMMVCGRVNRHNTTGKDGFDVFSLLLVEIAVGVVDAPRDEL